MMDARTEPISPGLGIPPGLERVFEAIRVPWSCRLYDGLTDDEDLRDFRQGGGPRALLRYGARRLLRRLLFPALFRLPTAPGRFRYRGPDERLVPFDPHNVQYESVYARRFHPCYEPRVSVLLAHLLPADGVFFDVGSNWGHFALFAAAVAGPDLVVHAFEPQPGVFRDLVRTVEAVGLVDRVVAHPVALGDREGRVTVKVPRGLESGLASVSAAAGPGGIRCAPLDRMGLPAPDVLKVDVEGYESRVFAGAAETLRASRPMVVFENTLGDPSSREALDILTDLEYVLFEPVWMLGAGAERRLERDDRGALTDNAPRLVLRSVRPEERTLLPRYVNLFACPADRVGEVEALVVR